MLVVDVQVSDEGEYLPPVEVKKGVVSEVLPPQTIISAPVHTVVCWDLAKGTFSPSEVAVQLFVEGMYLPPELYLVEP